MTRVISVGAHRQRNPPLGAASQPQLVSRSVQAARAAPRAVDVVQLRLLHAVVLVALVLDHHAHDVHQQGAEAAVDVVELRLLHAVVRVANREVR
eukprot:16452348-Heterocapsa_arctica.AAC.1